MRKECLNLTFTGHIKKQGKTQVTYLTTLCNWIVVHEPQKQKESNVKALLRAIKDRKLQKTRIVQVLKEQCISRVHVIPFVNS